MADLARIQQLLNGDSKFSALFLQDPVTALSRQGVVLSTAQQQDLRNQMATAKTSGGSKGGSGNIYLKFTFKTVFTTHQV